MRCIRIPKRSAILLAILILFLPGCASTPEGQPYIREQNADRRQEAGGREALCLDFFMGEMVTEQGGVRTNYLDKAHHKEFATGAEVLSESMGLLMLYAVAVDDEALFESSLGFVEGYLDTGKILSYRYSPKDGAYPVNALVDDMRIIRALILADGAFGGGYLDKALGYADRLYGTNIEDNRVYDMYDEGYGIHNDFITLCYIDLYTMKLLADHDGKWAEVYETMGEIEAGGYIGDDFPLYASSYSYAEGKYKEGDINMIEAALTALNLASVGECPQRTIDYLKDSIQNGAVYGVYSPDGVKRNTTESTAIYGICALIANEVRDEEMYRLCIDKMSGFQVMDGNSEVYGAFADPVSLELYSFDNLMALLAYGQR